VSCSAAVLYITETQGSGHGIWMALKVWQEDATIPNKKQKESRFGIIKKYN
jgi:hypothetical protein